jgi:hypothetical protein
MLRLLAGFLCAIAMLHAADPCDPWDAVESRQHFICLSALRAPLDQAPNDQHVLGLALASYDLLALPITDSLGASDQGNWLLSARQIRDRRVAARHGAALASFDEDLPELLLLVIEGRTAEAMDGLNRWPAAANDPRALALRTAATGDWRLLIGRASYSPLEAWALAWAMRDNDHSEDAAAWKHANVQGRLATRHRMAMQFDHLHLMRHLVGEVAFMLRSRDISDDDALQELDELAQAAGVSAAAHTRPALIQSLNDWSGRHDHGITDERAAIAAYRLCLRHLTAPQGVLDGAHHRLFGLGDLARWNRNWLHLTMARRALDIGGGEGGICTLSATIAQELPGTLIAAQTALRSGTLTEPPIRLNIPKPNKDTLNHLADAIAAEWIRDDAVSDGLVLNAMKMLAARQHGRCTELTRTALQRVLAAGSPALAREALSRMPYILPFTDDVPDTYTQLLASAQRNNPWDQHLREQQMWLQPGHPRVAPDAASWKPDATWIDPVIDHGKTPWKNSPQQIGGYCFIARWQGWLRIPADGTYRFTIDADDGARLEVGPLALDAWCEGSHRRTGQATFSAGWHPLDLGYFQGWGGTKLRLLWQPPGADKAAIVPAEALAHGPEHAPGLAAECRWHTSEFICPPQPDAAHLAWLKEHPWMSRAWANAGTVFAVNRRFAEALPWLDAAGHPISYAATLRDHAILETAPQRSDEAIRHIIATGDVRWNWSSYGENVVALAEDVIRNNATGLLFNADGAPSWQNQPDQHQLLFLGMLALANGDFRAAWVMRESLLGSNNDYALFWWSDYLMCRLETVALARLTNQPEPDLATIEDDLKRHDLTNLKDCERAWRYLNGTINAAAAAAEMNRPDDARMTWYFIGLQHLAEGRWDEARSALVMAAEANNRGWRTPVMAHALVQWIDRQTPEQRAAFPRGRTIPQPVNPDQGGNRF